MGGILQGKPVLDKDVEYLDSDIRISGGIWCLEEIKTLVENIEQPSQVVFKLKQTVKKLLGHFTYPPMGYRFEPASTQRSSDIE